jgi:hypothetical protein
VATQAVLLQEGDDVTSERRFVSSTSGNGEDEDEHDGSERFS